MRRNDSGPAVPGGFPTGARVAVLGGRHANNAGVVVDRAPDLRPGTVWVLLTHGGLHLIPGYRLAVLPTL